MARVGAKYQIYENGESKIYRLTKYKNDSLVVLEDCDNPQITKIANPKDIDNSYVELTPDIVLDLMITSYNEDNRDDDLDVYACCYRITDIVQDMKEPCLILRQDVYSYMKNPFAQDGRVYVGDCTTRRTVTPDMEKGIMSLMEFNHVVKHYDFALYSDDTFEDIFKVIGSKAKEFDKVLKHLHDTRAVNEMICGYEDNLKDLFKENHFMENYRDLFNIVPIDFPIVLGSESYDKDGNIVLNSKQKTRLEDYLRKHITNINIIEYGYDVDVSEIVSYSHVVVSDSNDKIYLIAYTVVDSYPVDDDIARAMGVE